MAVVVEDQVVGDSGLLPTGTDAIPDHSEAPASFTDLTLKKYFSPVSRPVFS